MIPVMAAGIETSLWSIEDVVRLVEWREDFRPGALLSARPDRLLGREIRLNISREST